MKLFPHPLTNSPIRFIDRSGQKTRLREGSEIRLSTQVPSLHVYETSGRPLLFHDPNHKPHINTYLSLPTSWIGSRESRVMLVRLLAVAAGLATHEHQKTRPGGTHFSFARLDTCPWHPSLAWLDPEKSPGIYTKSSVRLDPHKNTVCFLEEHPTAPDIFSPARFANRRKVLESEIELPLRLEVRGNELLLAQLLALSAGYELMTLDKKLKEETGVHRYGFGSAEQFAQAYSEPETIKMLREIARLAN